MSFRQWWSILFLLLTFAAPAWAKRDPGVDWRQTATEHFLLIYPAAIGNVAGEAARTVEEAYPEVKALFGFAPDGLTPLVLNPLRDDANGYSQGIFTKMEFYLAGPTGKWAGTRDASWLDALMYHEYAHLCHGLRAEGLTRVLTWIFGGVNAVNFVAPGWWNEGLAEYSETALTSGGRGRNPYHAMELAANLLSEHPWSLAQCGVSPRFDFPFDRTYLAGYDLVAGLIAGSGEGDAWVNRVCAEESAGTLFGVRPGPRGSRAGWEELQRRIWRDRSDEFIACYGGERPAAPGAAVAARDPRAVFEQPFWTEDGALVCRRDSTETGPALVRLDAESGRVETLAAPLALTGRMAYDARQRTFYYARLLPGLIYSGTRTADLFARGPRGERRLTAGGRCWSPDVAPDGRLICVVNQSGPTRLALLEPQSGGLKLLTGPKDAVYLSPRWSPDGKRLAAAVRLQGCQDICLVDAATGRLAPLTGWDEAGDHDPAWSPDGKLIFFVSDRTGVHQIYACNPDAGELYRVTDARFGAFDPAVSPDGKRLAFAEYRAGNYQQIVIAPLDPARWTPVPRPAPAPQPVSAPPAAPLPGEPYSAWAHLVPSFWLPFVSADRDGWMPGVISARQDPLELHTWLAQAYIQPASGRAYGALSYANDNTPLTLSASLFSLPLARRGRPGDLSDETLYWSREQGGSLTAALPLLFALDTDRAVQATLAAGGELARLSEADRTGFPAETFAAINGGVSFGAVRQEARDWFPTAGVTAALAGRAALAGYDGRRMQAEVTLHLPSPLRQQALALGLRGALQSGVFPENTAGIAPRGFTGAQFNSGQLLTAAASYRLPLWYIDQGPGLIPFFFHGLWIEGFAERGAGWDGPVSGEVWSRARTSAGAELHLEAEVFWYLSAAASVTAVWRQDAPPLVTVNAGLGF